MARGTNRPLIPAITFPYANIPTYVEDFESGVLDPAWVRYDTGTVTASTFGIVPRGAGSGFDPNFAAQGWLGLHATVSALGGRSFLRRTYTGFSPNATVAAEILVGLGFNHSLLYLDTRLFVSVNGSEGARTGDTINHRIATAQTGGTADASGNVTVDIGVDTDAGSGAGFAYWDALRLWQVTPPILLPTVLEFRTPLDGAKAYHLPKVKQASSYTASTRGGATHHAGVDYFLSGHARWIPELTIAAGSDRGSGWRSAAGWQDFLNAARDKHRLIWHPDRDNLAVGQIPCKLEEPMREPPDNEGHRHKRMRLVLRSLDEPFNGY